MQIQGNEDDLDQLLVAGRLPWFGIGLGRCFFGRAPCHSSAQPYQVFAEEMKLTEGDTDEQHSHWPQHGYQYYIQHHPCHIVFRRYPAQYMACGPSAEAAADGEGAEDKQHPAGADAPFVLQSLKHRTKVGENSLP